MAFSLQRPVPSPEGLFGQGAIDGDGGEQLLYLFNQQLLLAPQRPDLVQ